jgi:hypothetical protein
LSQWRLTAPPPPLQVLGGEIAPDELVELPPEELASDAKRGENQKIREKKLFDSAPAAPQATTNQFQCGKCKQRKCTYYQMQTRSADEPVSGFDLGGWAGALKAAPAPAHLTRVWHYLTCFSCPSPLATPSITT